MDPTVQTFSILIIVIAFATLAIGSQFVRRKRAAFPVRAISGYQALPGQIGLAIEKGQGLHVSLGSSGLGGPSSAMALAANELLYQISLRSSVGGTAPAVTMSEPTAIPMAYGTLQAALRKRGAASRGAFDPAVQWYAGGARSLAFAAAITGVMANERSAYNVFAGGFGTELALPLLASQRARAASMATSDQVEGQAVAFAMADQALLGEEVYAVGAYLGDSASALGGVIAQDVLRGVIIAFLILTALVTVGDALAGGAISGFLGGLLGGGS
ncbi:MAG: hypothetical protein JNL34_01660 [Anaerolineae bacterium]|nr:hypothetical protein [Anaerolineae bacterium]